MGNMFNKPVKAITRPDLPMVEGGKYPRLEAWIDRFDAPLLVLAIVSTLFHLLELVGLTEGWERAEFAFTVVVDLCFLLDLIMKAVAFGNSYRNSPWFLIDHLSCLPLLGTLATLVPALESYRVVRGLRMLRVLRGLRILRALRTIPAFEQFSEEENPSRTSWGYHRAMNVGMLALTGALLLTIMVAQRVTESNYMFRIESELAGPVSAAQLADLGGTVGRLDGPYVFRRQSTVNGKRVEVSFDMSQVDDTVDQFEFFLTLGMMFSMTTLLYIMAFHHRDVSRSQLRGLLNLALPRQLTEQFMVAPLAYAHRTRMPATVLFMDFVGFTRTCESLANDPDTLASHLEIAMDRIVKELTRHDMIIDKFIGDAVMSFRGGPLVAGTPADHAYRAVRSALSSIAALETLNDLYFHRVKIGGASADDCLIGAFGTSGRFSYTILGSGVNLAARLEPASAQCFTQNLFDEATWKLCRDRTDLVWRRWGKIKVAGRIAPIDVYEVFDATRVPDTAYLASFQVGLEAFERRDFVTAYEGFSLADSQAPDGDHPSRFYALRCEQLVLRGVREDWEPVFEAQK